MIGFDLGLFPKIYSPVTNPPVLLILNVFLEFHLHILYFSIVALALLMHDVKFLISELYLFLKLFDE